MSKKISSRHYSSQWTSDLADRHSPNWSLGIEIIEDRFKKRFFNPIKTLIENDTKEIRVNSGFLIMSIDCLIIETLNQFYLGLKTTTEKYYWRNNPDPNYRKNWQAFRDFFKHSHFFPDFKDNDDLTELFFKEIRCGLLHQAESKVNSLINIKNSKVIEPLQLGDYSQGIVINRNLFHEALEREFDKYIADLENPDSKNIFGDFLREKCNEKMEALCQ
jgi:hypothetical protein